jgi:hypothetical protein
MAIIGVVIFFGVGIGAFMLIYALWLGTTVSATAGWKMAGRGVLVALVSVVAGVALQFLHWWFFT